MIKETSSPDSFKSKFACAYLTGLSKKLRTGNEGDNENISLDQLS